MHQARQPKLVEHVGIVPHLGSTRPARFLAGAAIWHQGRIFMLITNATTGDRRKPPGPITTMVAVKPPSQVTAQLAGGRPV